MRDAKFTVIKYKSHRLSYFAKEKLKTSYWRLKSEIALDDGETFIDITDKPTEVYKHLLIDNQQKVYYCAFALGTYWNDKYHVYCFDWCYVEIPEWHINKVEGQNNKIYYLRDADWIIKSI